MGTPPDLSTPACAGERGCNGPNDFEALPEEVEVAAVQPPLAPPAAQVS